MVCSTHAVGADCLLSGVYLLWVLFDSDGQGVSLPFSSGFYGAS